MQRKDFEVLSIFIPGSRVGFDSLLQGLEYLSGAELS